MTFEKIKLERDGEVAIIIFNEPARLNPLSLKMQKEIRGLLKEFASGDEVRAVVLTGEGKAFCVGADLAAMDYDDGKGATRGDRIAEAMHENSNMLIKDVHNVPLPVISAINGPCAGAGVGLALAADIVLMAQSSYIFLPFMPRLGIIPDLGTTWFLERLVGRNRAVALSLLGERIQAADAVRYGLAWAVHEDGALRAEAIKIAKRLAQLPAHAMVETRQAMDAASRHTLEEQLSYEAETQRVLLNKPEFEEGVNAFQQKRDPVFKR